MHDRAEFWSPVPEWTQVSLQGVRVGVVPVNGMAAWLVSGDALEFLTRGQIREICGPRQICSMDAYALRLAPDRLLVVTSNIAIAPPHSNSNCTTTDISDGLLMFDVFGECAAELMAQGSEYPFNATQVLPLESATMNFGGFRVIVSRRAEGWRLHVERPWAAALWRWLEARIK